MGTPGCVNKRVAEREFVVDSGASMHMVSNKDRNSGELETMRTSRSPTTVMTANGEVQNKRRSHGKCQSIGPIHDGYVSWRNTCSSFTGSSVRIMGTPSTEPAAKNRISPKMAREIDSNISNYVSFVVPGLSTSSSATPTPTSSSSRLERLDSELFEEWECTRSHLHRWHETRGGILSVGCGTNRRSAVRLAPYRDRHGLGERWHKGLASAGPLSKDDTQKFGAFFWMIGEPVFSWTHRGRELDCCFVESGRSPSCPAKSTLWPAVPRTIQIGISTALAQGWQVQFEFFLLERYREE